MEEERKDANDSRCIAVDPLLDPSATSAGGAIDTSEGGDTPLSLSETDAFGGCDWLSAPQPIAPTISAPASATAQAPIVSSASAPSITGTSSTTLFTKTGQRVHPFANVTITDPHPGAIDTISIWINEGALDGPYLGSNGTAQGALSGPGLSKPPFDGYTLSGSAATVTKELRNLVWSPGPSYATLTQTSFQVQLQSSRYDESETNDDTNFVDVSTYTRLSVSNTIGNSSLTSSKGIGDWLTVPSSIIQYYFQNSNVVNPQSTEINPPTVQNITPFYTDSGKNAYLLITWSIYQSDVACPVQVLKYDAATKAFADATAQFFGSDPPEVVYALGVAIDDFNGDGQPDFFFGCRGPDGSSTIFAPDQLWVSTSSGEYVNESSTLPAIASGSGFISSGVVDKQGDIGIIHPGFGPSFSTTPYCYLISNGSESLTDDSTTFEPVVPQTWNGIQATPFLVDVSDDGLADLICPVSTSPGPPEVGDQDLELELFMNPGDGDFSQAIPIVLPGVPFADGVNTGGTFTTPAVDDIVSFKDWSGNFDDLVVLSTSSDEEGYAIQILMNNGDDQFTDETATRLLGAESSIPTDSYAMTHLFTADLNGKGPSIITSGFYNFDPYTDGSYSQVFLNNGKDVFTLAYSLASNPDDQTWNRYRGMAISAVEDIAGTETLILSDGGAPISFVPYEPPPQLKRQTSDKTLAAGKPFSFSLASNTFVDPKGLAMTYRASGEDFASKPKWLDFDAETLTFSGSAPKSAGAYDIMVTAYDPYGWLAEDSFTVTVGGSKA